VDPLPLALQRFGTASADAVRRELALMKEAVLHFDGRPPELADDGVLVADASERVVDALALVVAVAAYVVVARVLADVLWERVLKLEARVNGWNSGRWIGGSSTSTRSSSLSV
jgi:hypothetical protein